MTGAATYGRLRYDIHAMLAAHRRASARVDSRDPVVDSVLTVGHAGTAAAVRGSAWEEGAGDARTGGRRPGCLWPVRGARPIAGRPGGGIRSAQYRYDPSRWPMLEAVGEANTGSVRENQGL